MLSNNDLAQITNILLNDNFKELEEYINSKPSSFNIKQEETGNNIIHLCVLYNAENCLRFCIEEDERKKFEKNEKGETPLFMEGLKIIKKGKQKPSNIFNILAGNHKYYDKYIDEPDNRGYNILLESIEKGNIEFAEFLVLKQKSKIIKLVDNERILPLDFYWINKEAFSLKDQRGESLLYTAVRTKNTQFIKDVFEHHESYEISLEGPNETVVCFLASKKEEEYIKILDFIAENFRDNRKFNSPNRNDETPLQISLKNENLEAFKIISTKYYSCECFIPDLCSDDLYLPFIKLLFNNEGISVDSVDPVTNKTMLHVASENNCTEIIKYLMSKNASPLIPYNRTTLLHILAGDKKYSNVLNLILSNNSNFNDDIDKKNSGNLTAFEIAAIADNKEVFPSFIKAGASVGIVLRSLNVPEEAKNAVRMYLKAKEGGSSRPKPRWKVISGY